MEFSCLKDDLAKGVQIVEKAVGTKSTLPIIGNILIETIADGVKLASNNLEIGMEVIIPATVVKEGKVLAPAKTLGSIVSKLPDSFVNLEVFENFIIKINSGQSKFNIHGLAADEFLSLNKISGGTQIEVNAARFRELVKQVIFSVSLDESKHILNGVFFEFGWDQDNPRRIRAVATDGYRLALKEDIVENDIRESVHFVIPTKALQEVAGVISGSGEDNVTINVAADQVSFSYKNNYIITRIIQGQFPDFNQVIPKQSSTVILIDRKKFLDAADRCAVIASSSANIVKLENADSKLLITARTPEVGEVSELVDVEIQGEPSTHVSFNVKLLIDVLKIITEDRVAVNLSGSFNPGMVKPENSDNYIYVIMPIRTTDNR